MPKPTPEFEKNLADLAYATLSTNAPALMPYLVGFQALDSSEDESKSTSLFGFSVNGKWYYSPVFFFNGQIKGQDMLIGAKPKLLMPCTEEWVQHILNNKQADLGTTDEEPKNDILKELPNMRYLVGRGSLLGNSKSASANPCEYVEGEIRGKLIRGKSFDVTPFLEVMSKQANVREVGLSYADTGLVPDILKRSKAARDCLAVTSEVDDKLIPVMLEHYTAEELAPVQD